MKREKFEGKTLEEALEAACEKFGKAPEEVEYNVMDEFLKGPFGIMGKRIIIEAWLKEKETEEAESAAPMEEEELSEIGSNAKEKLVEIFRLMGVSAQVSVQERERELKIDVRGNGGMLIGSKGQTLDALQFIMERIASHASGEKIRVMLDINGYRRRRLQSLQALARRLSQKAIQTRRVVTVEQMSARDRRIIHMALEGVTGVTTRSEGEGDYRKLLIVPTGKQ